MVTKMPPEDYVKLGTARQRLSVFRLWFLILIILGLLAMIYVGYKVLSSEPTPANTQQQSHSLSGFLIPTAYAQATEQPSPDSSTANRSSELKQNIMVGIVGILAVMLLVSFGAVLLAKEPNKVTVAGDILKTVLGFFIGVATTFFGS